MNSAPYKLRQVRHGRPSRAGRAGRVAARAAGRVPARLREPPEGRHHQHQLRPRQRLLRLPLRRAQVNELLLPSMKIRSLTSDAYRVPEYDRPGIANVDKIKAKVSVFLGIPYAQPPTGEARLMVSSLMTCQYEHGNTIFRGTIFIRGKVGSDG